MPTKLSGIVLDEISLVDVPANKGARVVFAKRDEPTVPDTKISKLATVLATAFAKLGGDTKAEDFEAAITEAVTPATVNEPSKEPVKVEEPATGGGGETVEALKAALAKATSERDELKGKVEKLEGDVRKSEGMLDRLAKAEGTIAEFTRKDEVAKLAKELADEGVDQPEGTADTLLKLADPEVRKTIKERFISEARVMKTLSPSGSGSGRTDADNPPNSATAEIDRLAKKKAEESQGKLEYADAYASIYKSNHRLRERIEAEKLAKRRAA